MALPTKLTLHIVSPDQAISQEVDEVSMPGVEGDFGVLAGHAPFMTALKEGPVTVKDGGKVHVYQVRGGFADVTPEGFTILAEHATEVG